MRFVELTFASREEIVLLSSARLDLSGNVYSGSESGSVKYLIAVNQFSSGVESAQASMNTLTMIQESWGIFRFA